MSELSVHVGQRIRLYRKIKKLTTAQMADLIHKSRATLSKYEHGTIVIDLDTLSDIASALQVSLHRLIDYPLAMAPPPDYAYSNIRWLSNAPLYVYFYDGRSKRLTRSLLEPQFEGEGLEPSRAVLYLNVKDFSCYQDCMHLYAGQIKHYDSLIRFSLENQANVLEHLVICALDPLSQADNALGLITGLSSNPFMPVAIKCLLSKVPQMEDGALLKQLILSKEDFQVMRRINMFTPYRMFL